ncbi:Cobalt import ATP-binding protein CbiO [Dermatophilus congolensis]|uniref:ABC transporter ATP-binding protein n=1 Tax=Dermatophilus congolensis TaxID=1863 RepID=A0A239VFJ8_9MICO|nr:ATP-binding cassette domain-containing protein [Dermatophilus congolensis]SNV20937.1 Cobalt import ATP-binding protein CbiO [Dermatophilus congolensis]
MDSSVGLAARSVSFGYGELGVLSGVDFVVPVGCRVALLGANGCGKTTLLRLLSGALRPSSGQVLVDGVALRPSREGLRRHRQMVQLVLQDPDDQLFSADVYRDVSFGPVNLGLGVAQARERVQEALSLLDIADLAHRPTHALSFGQRKRVAIAGAVAMRPRFLLLDEPTAGLDSAEVDEFVVALERLESAGTTVVVATHDVDWALAWADVGAVVSGGQVCCGPVAEVLGQGSRVRVPWVLELVSRLGLEVDPLPRSLDDVVEVLRARGRF